VLRLTFSDGVETALYIDPESWLITRRREIRTLHPDIDPTPTRIETTMFDFRKMDELPYAFATVDTDLTTGKVLEKATVRSIVLIRPWSRCSFKIWRQRRAGRVVHQRKTNATEAVSCSRPGRAGLRTKVLLKQASGAATTDSLRSHEPTITSALRRG
jgi:hypothetical protein